MKNKKITYADMQSAFELVGAVNNTDAAWIFGSPIAVLLPKTNKREPIKNVTHSLMTRALLRDPDLAPELPEMPNLADLYQRAGVFHQRLFEAEIKAKEMPRFSRRLFGALLGKSAWSMTRYLSKGGRVPVSMQRLAFIMNEKLNEGNKGYLEWVQTVTDEAKARGFDSLRDLMFQANWEEK